LLFGAAEAGSASLLSVPAAAASSFFVLLCFSAAL